MNVTEHPTIVVYDCSANNNSAYSFSGCESLDEIKKVLLSQRQQNSSGTSIMETLLTNSYLRSIDTITKKDW